MIHLYNDYRVGGLIYEARCGEPMPKRGDCLTVDRTTITCPDCKECLAEDGVEDEKQRQKQLEHMRSMQGRIEGLAHIGEGTYGELEWLAIGASTLGVGLPFVWVGKQIAKGILRMQKKEDK